MELSGTIGIYNILHHVRPELLLQMNVNIKSSASATSSIFDTPTLVQGRGAPPPALNDRAGKLCTCCYGSSTVRRRPGQASSEESPSINTYAFCNVIQAMRSCTSTSTLMEADGDLPVTTLCRMSVMSRR